MAVPRPDDSDGMLRIAAIAYVAAGGYFRKTFIFYHVNHLLSFAVLGAATPGAALLFVKVI